MTQPLINPRGPWHHRVLTAGFSLLLGVLFYWLLGFVVRDIGAWPGPDYAEVERRLVEPALITEGEALLGQIEDHKRATTEDQGRQQVLRDSTDNAARTMGQLVEIQRLNAQRGVTTTEAEHGALRDAQQLFLAHQQQYQSINEKIAAQSEQLRGLEARQRDVERGLEAQRRPAREEFQRLAVRHQLKLAAVKLAMVVPLLAGVVVLFLKYRHGLYAPAIYALGLATLAKVLQVMHEHFPRRYFKYILLIAALLLVGRILMYLLRLAAFPRPDWLLKQYREAYEHYFCPVCNFPIRRGPLRFAFWTRRSLKRLPVPADAAAEGDPPYVCPVCSTRLFEECPACHRTRHSLLPACAHCGAQRQTA